jgi:hypothetical protein
MLLLGREQARAEESRSRREQSFLLLIDAALENILCRKAAGRMLMIDTVVIQP